MNVNEKLRLEDGTERVDAKYFRSLVGGLMYLTHTRPDIMFVISLVSRILCYICGTTCYGLWYIHVSNFELIGYTDSDWAKSLEDKKSTSSFLFNLGSKAISLSSKKQATTALSSSEAEYIVATKISCYNNTTITMTKNPIFHGRTKHIEIIHYFIRDVMSEGLIEMKFLPTKEQVADGFRKALSFVNFAYFIKLLGVKDFVSRGSVDDDAK
ncbi:hypothetical protein AMTRI_Chr08g163200 [Amborella trichopoda]